MNKAIELFDKILVNGQPIDLQELDTNSGVYSAGSQKTLKVDFVLKKKDEIPAKIFSGLSYLKSVVVPESVTTVGARAFENTGAEITGLEQVETFGEGALVGAYMSYMSEEFISYIQEHNPDAFISRYTELEAIAYNSYLPGALQYGAVKIEGHDAISYTKTEVDNYNATLNGHVTINDIEIEHPEIDGTQNLNFDYICDEITWSYSFTKGGLKKYYTANPEEDLWYEKLVYSFTSYSNAEGIDEYATGKVEVTDLRNDGATVKVLENSVEGFVGQLFNVNSLDENAILQLYSENGLEQQIWVKVQKDNENSVSRKSEITDKRVDFESYSDDQGTTKYGEGTVQVLEENPWNENKNYMKVKVLTNVTNDPNDANAQSFINQEFYVVKNAQVDNTTLYQLYTSLTTIDSKLTPSNPISVYVKLVRFYYPYCKQDWKGAYLNTGARYPWIIPYFNYDINAKLRFEYEGKTSIYPWGDGIFGKGEGHKEWGCASLASEFQDKGFLITENQNNYEANWTGEVGANNFDINKFKMIIVKEDPKNYTEESAAAYNLQLEDAWQYGKIKTPAVQEELYTNEEVDAFNAQLPGAIHAGDVKHNYIEVEPGNGGQESQGEQQGGENQEDNQTVNGEVNSEDDGNTQIYNG